MVWLDHEIADNPPFVPEAPQEEVVDFPMFLLEPELEQALRHHAREWNWALA